MVHIFFNFRNVYRIVLFKSLKIEIVKDVTKQILR